MKAHFSLKNYKKAIFGCYEVCYSQLNMNPDIEDATSNDKENIIILIQHYYHRTFLMMSGSAT